LPRWGKAPPTQAKKFLQGKSTTLAGHLHSKHHHQKKRTRQKQPRQGFHTLAGKKKIRSVGVLQGTPTGKKTKQNKTAQAG